METANLQQLQEDLTRVRQIMNEQPEGLTD